MFINSFPKRLKNDVTKVIDIILSRTYKDVSISASGHIIEYYIDGEIITFPDRIYFIETSDDNDNKLNLQQEMILHCIYSRSCDGYVRQRHIQSLLSMDYENWTIPYIVKVCDEYVIEILDYVYDILKEHDTQAFKSFCKDNAYSLCKSYARMVSYWNEYYRYKYYKLNEYIGYKLFKECFGYTRAFEKSKK